MTYVPNDELTDYFTPNKEFTKVSVVNKRNSIIDYKLVAIDGKRIDPKSLYSTYSDMYIRPGRHKIKIKYWIKPESTTITNKLGINIDETGMYFEKENYTLILDYLDNKIISTIK